MSARGPVLLVLLCIATTGCGKDPEGTATDDQACGLLQGQPLASAEATADPVAASPRLLFGELTAVQLQPLVQGFGGYLQLNVPAAGAYAVYTDAVTNIVVERQGQDVPVTFRRFATPSCEQARTFIQVDLPAGVSHVGIGPTIVADVKMVALPVVVAP